MRQAWSLSERGRVSEGLTQDPRKDERTRSGSCRDQSKRRTSIGRTLRSLLGCRRRRSMERCWRRSSQSTSRYKRWKCWSSDRGSGLVSKLAWIFKLESLDLTVQGGVGRAGAIGQVGDGGGVDLRDQEVLDVHTGLLENLG
jgi:hypothetical protein